MITAFPKIFHLGDRNLKTLHEGRLEITEKLDGSQIAFSNYNGVLLIRSKGAFIKDSNGYCRKIDSLFSSAIQHIEVLHDKKALVENYVYYGEVLSKPKHNTLTYGRVPLNNIALFGVLNEEGVPLPYTGIYESAKELLVDCVPLIAIRQDSNPLTVEELETIINRPSYLGGCNIEGIVCKNYKEYFVGGQLLPLMAGKYVSEKFKELHKTNWKKDHTSKGSLEVYKESFKTDARWRKAIQFLRDNGELTNSPKDIGPLVKRIQEDILEEEKENIKEHLYRMFINDILRESIKGFPEAYKKFLIGGEL